MPRSGGFHAPGRSLQREAPPWFAVVDSTVLVFIDRSPSG
jgi:hypothetical protein